MGGVDSARRNGFFRLLWPHVAPQAAPLLAALILGLLIAGLSAVQPLLTRMAIDEGLIGRHFARLVTACAGMLGLALAGMALGAAHRVLYVRASGRALFALRGAVYAHLLRVSPRRLSRVPVGDVVSRLDGDVAEVQRFGTDAVPALIGGLASLAVIAVIMAGLSWRLTLLVAALVPLQLLVRHVARPRLESSTRRLREGAAGVSSFLIETVAGARHVQSAAAEIIERRRLETLGEDYLRRTMRQQLTAFGVGAASGLLGHMAMAATFVLGGWYVLHGQITVGTLVAFAAYLGRSAGSASSLAGLYTGYQRSRVSLARIHELLDLPAVAEAADALPLDAGARGALRLESVTVRAGEGRALLDEVCLDLPAGSKLNLQGASGAGKSTLADLLRRFVEPEAGRILLDGRPLRDYRLEDLRRRVAVVEHSPVLFRGTILDNLRYGLPHVDEATALAAAARARVDEFAADLPMGYATPVGEGGASLSTGQRQRIAIARAMLADPLIVILDEALSGIDVQAAREVQGALDAAFAHRTRIVITHRSDDIDASGGRWEIKSGKLSPARRAG